MSPSTALPKEKSSNALMAPPPLPPAKRQKRPPKVLDEDLYAEALSHIVARDFFPGLLESSAQGEYLQALDSKDNTWIRDAGRKLTQVMTPLPEGSRRRGGRGTSFTPRRSMIAGETPRGYGGSTPGATPAGSGFAPETTTSDVDVNMSLSAFQAKYTSEDNESFNALLDRQNAQRAAKYAFFRQGNKIAAPRQIAYRKAQEQKLLEAANSNSGTTSTALITTNAAGEMRQAISEAGGPSQDLAARPASVASFPDTQGPRNPFMFAPDSVEDTSLTYAQAAEQASNAPPKSVTYTATRFPTLSASQIEHLIPASPSLSAIDAAIAGRPRPTHSEAGYTGEETPRIKGYAFVDAEPTPSELGLPVTDEDAEAAEREAAMALLPKADTSGPNPFTINERSKREDVHMRLVERADLSRRKEGRGGGGRLKQLRGLEITPGGRTPTPKFASSPRVTRSEMTPAARMLARQLGRTPRVGEGGAFGGVRKSGRGEWMPATPKG